MYTLEMLDIVKIPVDKSIITMDDKDGNTQLLADKEDVIRPVSMWISYLLKLEDGRVIAIPSEKFAKVLEKIEYQK